MNKHITSLAGLLVVQLIVILFLWSRAGENTQEGERFLEFSKQSVDSIQIEQGDQSVRLSATDDDGWLVNDYPADGAAIDAFLDKLSLLDARWPVASTTPSQERFEVSSSNYQRLIRLLEGDEALAEFYLGTSPGYEKVHAREVDSDNIYSVALSNYEIAVTVDHWLDKALFAVQKTPVEVTVNFADAETKDAHLSHSDEGWLYNDKAADQAVASTYANRFTSLRVLGVADAGTEAQPIAEFVLNAGFEPARFSLFKSADADEYLIRATGEDTRYRLASYTAEQLLMTDADFSPKDSDTTDEAESSGAS